MSREEIKNKVIEFFRKELELKNNRPDYRHQIQMGNLYELFRGSMDGIQPYKHDEIFTVVRETVQEFINNGFLYPGLPGDQNSDLPWLTITSYGKEAFFSEDWLPYDPEGYLKALRDKVPDIDDVTLSYIGESVVAFNQRHLLSATLTIGVASENLMLLLIEAYIDWLKGPRKSSLSKKIVDRWIYTQYKEFKQEFSLDVRNLPKELQSDWEVYLDGVFNFIRLNRNDAGHPTGKALNAKVVYANLQIFADYSRYIFDLIKYFRSSSLKAGGEKLPLLNIV